MYLAWTCGRPVSDCPSAPDWVVSGQPEHFQHVDVGVAGSRAEAGDLVICVGRGLVEHDAVGQVVVLGQ